MNEDDVEVGTLLGVLYPDNERILELIETNEDDDDA